MGYGCRRVPATRKIRDEHMAVAAEELEIVTPDATLYGALHVPDAASGIVVFAHGSGSSRHSPRNQRVADTLREGGLGTLLFDLLTAEEERIDAVTAELRFDIEFLAGRLVSVTDWLIDHHAAEIEVGYFGSSTGAAAALIAATRRPHPIGAIVSRGGRPDLAHSALEAVQAPTLLIVGGHDWQVLELNERALERMRCEKKLAIVPGATHLFQEPGALEEVSRVARTWFVDHFTAH